MPLCRVRQAVECISDRRVDDLRVQANLVEWHAKHVASVSAASDEAGKQISSWRVLDENPEDSVHPMDMTEDELEQIIFGEDEGEGADDPRNAAGMEWLERALQPMRPPEQGDGVHT